MFNILVFSHNRAAQLDMTLNSIKEFCSAYKVFVTTSWSNEEYATGYNKLYDLHPSVTFMTRQNLIDDINTFLSFYSDYVAFMTDDSIFFGRPDYTKEELDKLFAFSNFQSFSHRIGLNTIRQDPFNINIPMNQPAFNQLGQHLVWNRATVKEFNNYSYPFSVDGNIYRTDDIIDQIYSIDKNSCPTPNYFEVQMCERQEKTFNACSKQSCLVTIPANRVQSEFENGHAGLSAEILNQEFLLGRRLKTKMTEVLGSHQVMEFYWI